MKKQRLLVNLMSGAVTAAVMLCFFAPKGSVVYATSDENVSLNASASATQADGGSLSDADIENNQEEQVEQEEQEMLSDDEKAVKEALEARLALQKDPSHIHHFKWIARMNESESAEGTINYMCADCDKVWYFRPYPAFHSFQGDVARRIEVAPQNATVKVKTSLFGTFTTPVMKALSERPDVSLYVSFLEDEYKGDRLGFVIPAGEDALSLLDENGYAGFKFLGGKYGMTVEESHKKADADTTASDKQETSEAATNTVED